jgi:DNA-binding transcriptional LysR family regulator
VKDALASGELVAPFKRAAEVARAYYAIVSSHAHSRPEVADFVGWLKREAAADEAVPAATARPRKKGA